MNDSIIRYQYNPMLTDTVGFFDYCIPLTNENLFTKADSLQKYYDFSIYNFITPLPPQKQFLQTTSVFKPHNLEPKHSGPMVIDHQATNWITIVFLACLFIFAWIQATYSKRLSQIFRAVAQPHHVNQLERDGNIFKERIALGLGLNYYLITSIFIFQIIIAFGGLPAGLNNLTLTGIIFAGLLTYQLLKSLIIHSTGIIFNTAEYARQYQLIILIFNYMIGLVLFPVVVVAFYWNNPAFLIAGSIIFSISIIYQIVRGFLTGQDNKSYNLFYLFLYLCTLEILPLMLIYKAISKM
ncbi:MAG: DUF4271 domain-containing protein [Bacteroidales bacterium]|nr:DUF4271 domain-containing protein [Bacteroidales bacterium]